MRRFWAYVGMYAIAGVIVAFLKIYIALFFLLLSPPLVLIFEVLGWFNRFGFAKRMIVYHLMG
jgi:hypothetical protein